jgi:uncharacterized protein
MELKVEIADNPISLAYGLMGVKDLPKQNGMFFKFPFATEARFWGKNTYIPLDVAFVDSNNQITSIKSITPLSTRMVTSDGLCTAAIEANAGYFQENGIKKGYKIKLEEDNPGFKILFQNA